MAAPDLALVRRWLSEHSNLEGLSIEPRSTQQLHDTYLDTDDWRIYRAGFALRLRNGSGKHEATLKSLKSAREDLADRIELNERLGGSTQTAVGRLAGPVGTRVHAVAGRQPLHPLFEVRTRRQRYAIRDHEQADLAEIALDETVISRPEGEARASVQRVEIEVLGSQHRPLEKLVASLCTECALQRVPQSKYELGLQLVGLDPTATPQFAQTSIDASMSAAEAATTALRRLLAAWLTQEPAARLGDDPEAVHALRVTARRMEALLGLFARHVPRPLMRLRPKLKSLLRLLGAVRDADLQLASLASFGEGLTEPQRAALEPLRQHLESERTRARLAMLRALDAKPTAAWFERMTQTLLQPASPTDTAPSSDTLLAVAPALIRDRFRKLRKTFRQLPEHAAMEDYHRARRRAKKVRYAIEPVAVLYGKPAEELLRTLRRLQDHLGTQQDAHVAMTRLLALATDPPAGLGPTAVFLMGRLAERQVGCAADAHKGIGKAWRKLRGSRWRALRARMQEVSEQPPTSGRPVSTASEPTLPAAAPNAKPT